jgi:hypothetical protein
MMSDRSGSRAGSMVSLPRAVTVEQRTSSDFRLNPHLHVLFLDGTYHERDGQLAWQSLGHLKMSEVGEVLERAVRRIDKHLRRSSPRWGDFATAREQPRHIPRQHVVLGLMGHHRHRPQDRCQRDGRGPRGGTGVAFGSMPACSPKGREAPRGPKIGGRRNDK